MADITRRFADILKEVWAEEAQTTIPTRPISGMAYRDPDAEFSTGQQFDSLGESSRWNQLLYLLSGLIMEMGRFGIMPWSSTQPYQKGALCLGPDGNVWQAQKDLPASPNNPVRPGSDLASWKNFSQTLSVFSGATATATGTSGTVPVPQKGQQDFILRGDGEWKAFPVSAATTLGGVMVNKSGLQVSASGLLSLLLMQGGGLSINAFGQLYVDTSDFSEEMLRAFLEGIIADGGGLGFDQSGKLYVDADAFSDDLLGRFLKSIRVPIWLSKPLNIYVAKTGSDTLDEGRGLSADKPFATLQAALNYVSSTYNLYKYSCIIHVGAGDYGRASIDLPSYTTTTGTITITGPEQDNPSAVKIGRIYNHYGCYYTLQDITAKPDDSPTYYQAIYCTSGTINLVNVVLDISETVVDNGVLAAITAEDSGKVRIYATNDLERKSGITIRAGAVSTRAMIMTSGGTVQYSADISIEGDCAVSRATVVASRGASVYRSTSNFVNPGRAPVVTASGVITGRRYVAELNGVIDVAGGGPDFFPGSEAGTLATGGQYA